MSAFRLVAGLLLLGAGPRLHAQTAAVRLATGWEYRVAETWHPLDQLSRGDLKSSRGLWLRVPLPQAEWDGAQLILQGSAAPFTVYLADAELYRYSGSCEAAARQPFTWQVIPLPPGYGGKTLQILLPCPIFGSISVANSILAPRAALPAAFDSEVRQRLRRGLLYNVLAVILCAVGVAALLLFSLRWKNRDWQLLTFGLFSFLYGLRLLASSFAARLLLNVPQDLLLYVLAIITYTINVPFFLFVAQSIGKGWRSSLRWPVYAAVVFAIVATVAEVVRGTPESMATANSVLVILAGLVMLPNIYRARRWRISGARVLGAGIVVFAIFVLNTNLGPAGWRPGNIDPEPVGVFILFCCIGYVAVLGSIRKEQRLLAIEHELETARRIQASILPRRMPSLPGLSVAARYVPMAAVAGDFYDFLMMDGARLGILIADVSGHGVPAALVASMVKVAFSSQAPHAYDPGRVLTGLNEIFCGKLDGQFVTAGYAFLDPQGGWLRYAGAGHPALLLVRRTEQKVLVLQENGLFLGPFQHATYSHVQEPLEAGDRLLMYTDGVVEATSTAGEAFGEQRLREFAADHGHLTPDAFADSLLEYLSAWSGRSSGRGQEDDLTLIVADVTGRES